MKSLKILLIGCFIFWGIGCNSNQNDDDDIRMMTFNIRLNTPSDSLNAWRYRKDMVASMIHFHKADIIGVQEALWDQVQDMEKRLPEYARIGVGRDDGQKAGEFMAIYYRKNRFYPLEHGTFWLSESPEKPGKGWDAACNRTVTWCRFKDTKTRKEFFHFNTHFDHMGEIARRESAVLLLKKIAEMAGNLPVVVTGDFNSKPDSEPYKILINGIDQADHLKLINSKQVSRFPHHGSDGTFNWFQIANLANDQPIDYIFIKNKIDVIYHGTLTDTFNGKFPSDHMPVLAEISIN